MRTIERSTAFKRDYKRESKGRHRATLDADLIRLITILAADKPLDSTYRDHDLGGVGRLPGLPPKTRSSLGILQT